MPEHSFAAGHLQILASIVKIYPRDAIKIYLFGEIGRKFSKAGAYYLDLWPFSEPFLVITSPYLANQVVSNPAIALEKPDALRKWFWSITGGISIFDAPADKWKPLRALFNRGFSATHLMTIVPTMVEETQMYCETLREHARKRDLFYLDPTNLRFMLDIIGQIGLYVYEPAHCVKRLLLISQKCSTWLSERTKSTGRCFPESDLVENYQPGNQSTPVAELHPSDHRMV